MGRVARQDEERWSKRFNLGPRQMKRSVGRPAKRWLDDVKKVAGNSGWLINKKEEEDGA